MAQILNNEISIDDEYLQGMRLTHRSVSVTEKSGTVIVIPDFVVLEAYELMRADFEVNKKNSSSKLTWEEWCERTIVGY